MTEVNHETRAVMAELAWILGDYSARHHRFYAEQIIAAAARGRKKDRES